MTLYPLFFCFSLPTKAPTFLPLALVLSLALNGNPWAHFSSFAIYLPFKRKLSQGKDREYCECIGKVTSFIVESLPLSSFFL
jgi:hypothetical protein